MPSTITPSALKPGASIGFISPSARLNERLSAGLARATAYLVAEGYQVREFYNPDTGVQSSITNRLLELRAAFSDPSISAIICTCGGPSFTELLPSLIADTELHSIIRAQPKIVVGYSDITGLHWFLHALTGLRTFYGPGVFPELCEPKASDRSLHEASPLAFCFRNLYRAITDPNPIGDIARSPTYAPEVARVFSEPESTELPKLAPTTGWTWLRPGKATGRLFGGCLTVMVRLGGIHAVVPDWRGRIVFFETALGDANTAGPPLYRVRAGVADLIAQGVFDDAAGLVIGRPFGYDTEEMQKDYMGVMRELLCEGPLAQKAFPILFNVDIGHTTPMVTLPYDALAVLDSEDDRFAVVGSAVSAD